MKTGDIELLIEIGRFEDSHDMEKEYKIGYLTRQLEKLTGCIVEIQFQLTAA